jgi:glycosyltransferase involved in cell wall biosynthesis
MSAGDDVLTGLTRARTLETPKGTSDDAMPCVTVAIPTRERWDFARRALESALAQEDVAIEVVIVDDGSRVPVETGPELHDSRVRVIKLPDRVGVSAARNAAISQARGEWVAFLDDDDLWAPNKLARQLEVAKQTGAEFIWTGQVVVDGDLRPQKAWSPPSADGIAAALLEVNRIGGPSCVIAKRSAIEAAGGFDEDLSLLADWDMWIRLLAHAAPAACDDLLTAYTIHDSNMHIVEIDSAVAEHAHLVRKHGPPLGGARFWEWVALGYRRQGRRFAAANTYMQMWRESRRVRDLGRAAVVLLGEGAMQLGSENKRAAPPTGHDWLQRHAGAV